MRCTNRRIAVVVATVAAVTLTVVAPPARAAELALAEGPVVIRDASTGGRAPACTELVVEARDALDNHLIARSHAALDPEAACRYAVSVPAQTAVWLRLRPVLVADARAGAGFEPDGASSLTGASRASARPLRAATGSVALRFRIVAPATFFFAPGEQKTFTLTY